MITIDLITGFLGAGKTTFIRKYATHLMEQGLNIGILENDHGAVNVDAMLLQDILGEHCTLEMVAGGCDADCHKRRFKTKLIAMGMCGYDRILVEPSGIFDMDEFLTYCTKIRWNAGIPLVMLLLLWMFPSHSLSPKHHVICSLRKHPKPEPSFSATWMMRMTHR